MNKEYTIVGNKAIVMSDDKEYVTDYYDGIDEVLNQENVVELIEKKVSDLEKKKINNIKKPKSLLEFLGFLVLPFPTSLLLLTLFKGDLQSALLLTDHTIFGEMSTFLSVAILEELTLSIPFGLVSSIGGYLDYKNKLSTKRAIEVELNKMQTLLKDEKEKLNLLRDKYLVDDVRETKNTIDLKSQDTKNSINKFAKLYYDLGYDFEKLYKEYKNDNIESYLNKYYKNINRDEAIAIIEQEVKEVENRESSKQLKRVLK